MPGLPVSTKQLKIDSKERLIQNSNFDIVLYCGTVFIWVCQFTLVWIKL